MNLNYNNYSVEELRLMFEVISSNMVRGDIGPAKSDIKLIFDNAFSRVQASDGTSCYRYEAYGKEVLIRLLRPLIDTFVYYDEKLREKIFTNLKNDYNLHLIKLSRMSENKGLSKLHIYEEINTFNKVGTALNLLDEIYKYSLNPRANCKGAIK